MKKVAKAIGGLVQNDNGKASSTRIILFAIVGTILFNYTWSHVTTGQLPAFDIGELSAIMAALGLKGFTTARETK